MAWVYLVIAGIFECGWPLGLKLAWTDQGFSIMPAVFAGFCIVASSVLLMLAQRTIPMGTAYAVWTGIGTVGAFFIGIGFFGDSSSLVRYVCVGLIVMGIIGLKLSAQLS
jgi:quaternary ammonium compound-resistance protein SugE